MAEILVAIDDTDSPSGGCTTYLTYDIILRLTEKYALLGYPRLVRLNPTVPWKTRGNGATVFRLAGAGKGERWLVGERWGRRIEAWGSGGGSVDLEDVRGIIESALEEVSRRWEENSPGFVISERPPEERLYWMGVREVVGRDVVERMLADAGAIWGGYKGGRGVVGAACAMAWRGRRHTYEVLAYREEEMWGRERRIYEEEVRSLDERFPSTFNNYDRENGHVAIRPNTPCPVLVGIRGIDDVEVVKAYRSLTLEKHQGYLLYRTNQATDDHLQPIRSGMPAPGSSYLFRAHVARMPRRGRGGHAFVDVVGEGGFEITLAAYRQTGSLRNVLMTLRPGDTVVPAGSIDTYPNTLNLEKIAIVSAPPIRVKEKNPVCPKCGRRMKSSGRDGFRCTVCGVRVGKEAAQYSVMRRDHLIGIYEASVSARRHLARPIKLMDGEEVKRFLEADYPGRLG